MPSDNKNMFDKASDATKDGFDNARGVIQDMTKSKEQKDAEKPIGQKINDNTPDSAQEAGQNVGGMLDHGAKATKDKFNDMNSN